MFVSYVACKSTLEKQPRTQLRKETRLLLCVSACVQRLEYKVYNLFIPKKCKDPESICPIPLQQVHTVKRIIVQTFLWIIVVLTLVNIIKYTVVHLLSSCQIFHRLFAFSQKC